MVYDTLDQRMIALLQRNDSLRVDPGMNFRKPVDRIPEFRLQRFQETTEGLCLVFAFDLGDAILLHRQSDRMLEDGGNADIPGPPTERAVKDKDPGRVG